MWRRQFALLRLSGKAYDDAAPGYVHDVTLAFGLQGFVQEPKWGSLGPH